MATAALPPFQRAGHALRGLLRRGGPAVGEPCPEFELADLEGRLHRLSDAVPGRAALLWLTNLCEGCQARFPFVNRLAHRQVDRLAVWAISVLGDDRATPTRVRRDLRPSFPILLDPLDWVGRELWLSHAGTACPMTNALLVAPDGRVAWRGHLSAARDAAIEKAVRATYARDPPSAAIRRSSGAGRPGVVR